MNKFDIMKEIERYEDAYIDLTKWKVDEDRKLNEETIQLIGKIETSKDKESMLRMINQFIEGLKTRRELRTPGKLFLNEIINKENPQFSNNNLILSPVGSGKTTFARSLIKENDHVLFLVSTTSLKNSLVSKNEEKRKEQANRMYTTKIKNIYGKENYKILVATYHEFGKQMEFVDDFAKQFDLIICDEIHSLPIYKNYDNSPTLLVAMRYLFKRHENQPKYYFTATNEYINLLTKQSSELMRNVLTFDYLNHSDIMKYVPLSSYSINSLEQSRLHLRARKESFKYFGHKIFAYCKTIESQKRLQEICEDEGFSAQIYWSIHNEEKKMTDKQIEEIENIIDTGILPDEYDVIIINSAMQEGWNLIDTRVKLSIMNTTNETEYVQALGRIRRDLDILVCRINEDDKIKHLSIPKEYLDRQLTAKEKRELCEKLDARNKAGALYKWETINKMLKTQGFLISDENSMINGKKTRTSTIHSR